MLMSPSHTRRHSYSFFPFSRGGGLSSFAAHVYMYIMRVHTPMRAFFSFSACDSRVPEGRNNGATSKKTFPRACAICKRHASLFLARCATSAALAERPHEEYPPSRIPPPAIFFFLFSLKLILARNCCRASYCRERRAVSESYAG